MRTGVLFLFRPSCKSDYLGEKIRNDICSRATLHCTVWSGTEAGASSTLGVHNCWKLIGYPDAETVFFCTLATWVFHAARNKQPSEVLVMMGVMVLGEDGKTKLIYLV